MKKTILLFLLITAFASAQSKFHLNPDASVDSVFYPAEDITAAKIYDLIPKWIQKQNENKLVSSNFEKKTIIFDGTISSAIEKFVDGKANKLNAEYRLSILIKDNEYTMFYNHKRFTNSDGSQASLKIKDLLSRTSDDYGNFSDGMKAEFEESVQRLMNSLYMFTMTN